MVNFTVFLFAVFIATITADPAFILQSITTDYLSSCHTVILHDPNYSPSMGSVIQKFLQQLQTPVLIYAWSPSLSPPSMSVLGRYPSNPGHDMASKSIKQEFCVVYYIFYSDPHEAFQVINEARKMNWFPISKRFLIWYTDTDVTPKDIEESVVFEKVFNLLILSGRRSSGTEREKGIFIFGLCPFCSSGYPTVVLKGVWTPGKGLSFFSEPFYDFNKGFNGKYLRASSTPLVPYEIHTVIEPGEPVLQHDSLEYWVIKAIAEYNQFTYEFYEPLDGEWAFQFPNGTFSGVLGMVINEEADFGTNLLRTWEREQAVDFSNGFLFDDPLTFAISNPKLLPQWLSLINPYEEVVWVCLLVCLLVGALIYWALSVGGSMGTSLKAKFSLGRAAFDIFGSLLSQNRCWYNSVPSRVFVAFWLLFTVVLARSYVGNLTAHLTVPTMSQPLDSLSELVDSNYEWGVISSSGSDYSLFKFSAEDVPLYKTVYEKITTCGSSMKCLRKTLDDKFAFISWKQTIRAEVASSFTDKHGKPKVYIAKRDFYPMQIGLSIQIGSPLKEPFDRSLIRLVEGGFPDYWLDGVIENMKPNATNREDASPAHVSEGPLKINLHHLQGIFIILGAGFAFSILIFVIEFFCC